MKHIFIVNPVSGQGDVQKRLVLELAARGLDHYLTKSPGDGENFVRETCEANRQEAIRFYACGGDGTLNEVVNGAFGFENAEVACVPTGSGNDFIRNFGVPAENFSDIDRQLSGIAVAADLIRYRDSKKSPEDRYAANMVNIGFDCNVVATTEKVKKFPLIRGSFAYFISILIMLVRKKGEDLAVGFDDGSRHDGPVLLTAVGNGAFCGGGLKGVPLASVSDGLLDVCIIENVPRRILVSLLPKYAKGSYLDDSRAQGLITYKKCKSVAVKNAKESWLICVDGEVIPVGEVRFEIVPAALKFSVPG